MKVAVDKQSGADAGGQPEIQHVPRTPARAPGELGDGFQPGVVVHQQRYVEMPAELGRDVHPGPRLTRQRRSDHAGLQVERPGDTDRDADQTVPIESGLAEQVVEQRESGREPLLPRGVAGRGHAVTGERPAGQVGEVAPDAFEGEVQTGGRARRRVGPQETASPAVDLRRVDAGLRHLVADHLDHHAAGDQVGHDRGHRRPGHAADARQLGPVQRPVLHQGGQHPFGVGAPQRSQ
jgi:hypothetical protein